jgi:hypothetical protein
MRNRLNGILRNFGFEGNIGKFRKLKTTGGFKAVQAVRKPNRDVETEARRFAKSKLLTTFSPENGATVHDRFVENAPMQRLKWVESEAAGVSNARTVTL